MLPDYTLLATGKLRVLPYFKFSALVIGFPIYPLHYIVTRHLNALTFVSKVNYYNYNPNVLVIESTNYLLLPLVTHFIDTLGLDIR